MRTVTFKPSRNRNRNRFSVQGVSSIVCWANPHYRTWNPPRPGLTKQVLRGAKQGMPAAICVASWAALLPLLLVHSTACASNAMPLDHTTSTTCEQVQCLPASRLRRRHNAGGTRKQPARATGCAAEGCRGSAELSTRIMMSPLCAVGDKNSLQCDPHNQNGRLCPTRGSN